MVRLIVGKVIEMCAGYCDWCGKESDEKVFFCSSYPVKFEYIKQDDPKLVYVGRHIGYSTWGLKNLFSEPRHEWIVSNPTGTLKTKEKHSAICKYCVKQLAANK